MRDVCKEKTNRRENAFERLNLAKYYTTLIFLGLAKPAIKAHSAILCVSAWYAYESRVLRACAVVHMRITRTNDTRNTPNWKKKKKNENTQNNTHSVWYKITNYIRLYNTHREKERRRRDPARVREKRTVLGSVIPYVSVRARVHILVQKALFIELLSFFIHMFTICENSVCYFPRFSVSFSICFCFMDIFALAVIRRCATWCTFVVLPTDVIIE